jgi:hypothetical protein
MAFLFCAGPTITFGPVFSDEPASVTVACSPLVGVIQDRYFYSDLDTSSSYHGHYETISGTPPPGTAADPTRPEREIDAACQRRRSAWAGLIGLLAAPAAILTTVTLSSRRDQTATQPQDANTATATQADGQEL